MWNEAKTKGTMRYSIIGFNQEKILSIRKIVTKNDKEVEIKLDVTDLLILQDIADFMNRSKVIKHTIDDKIYFSMQYQTILEDLPILTIQKQALADRIDKMSILGLLEKKVIKNQCGTFTAFRLSEQYENLLYSRTSSQTTPTSSQLQVQEYSTTNHNTNYTNNSSLFKKEKDKSFSKKNEKDELFEECWKAYKRKGLKAKAKTFWDKLSNEDKSKVKLHIPHYVSSVSEITYIKDFERYLKDKIFLKVVYKKNAILFDPERINNLSEYTPQCDGISLMWNDVAKCYLTPFDITTLSDGYTKDNRPNGAVVMWRGYKYKWNGATKQWEIE